MTGSVGLENEKNFALKLYDSFDAKSTRIVTYAYSTEAKVVAELSSNFRAGKEAVRKYSGQDGAPNAVSALAQCNATLAPAAKRHRIVLLFVHGPDSFVGPILETADSMKRISTDIACIALRNKSASAGGLPAVGSMAKVASEASKYGRKMVYFVDIYDALDNDAVDTVKKQTCSVVGKLSPALSGWAIAAIILALIAFAMVASCVLFCKFARSPY
jgi:von Willebrand factor type A domain